MEYIKIVNRFAHIISGQFYGHSHYDEFSIFYTTDNNPSKSLNVAWNGGSGIIDELNSNYRVYYVDGESYVFTETKIHQEGNCNLCQKNLQEVIDHETWIFNLTEANQAPDSSPNWFKEYSFKEFYQIPDLSPDTLSEMVTNKWMKEDNSLMTKVS